MKKFIVSVCALVLFLAGFTAHAQQGGFTGPMTPLPGQTPAGFTGPQGFVGPLTPVTVAQIQTFPDKAPAIMRGNIVAALGGDLYLFRDSSGEVVIKIKRDRWWGLTVGANDLVEIGGELKRDKRTWQINHFDAKSIRRA